MLAGAWGRGPRGSARKWEETADTLGALSGVIKNVLKLIVGGGCTTLY